MPAIPAKGFRVQLGDGGSPEVFTAIGGERESRFRIENADTGPSARVEILGVCNRTASEDRLAALAAGHSPFNLRLVVGNGHVWTGRFRVAEYEIGDARGEFDGAVVYRSVLVSDGAVVLEARP